MAVQRHPMGPNRRQLRRGYATFTGAPRRSVVQGVRLGGPSDYLQSSGRLRTLRTLRRKAFQVDDAIGHRGELGGLAHEELTRVPAKAQHLAFHGHEHALVLRVQRTVCLVAEQRADPAPGVAGQVERDRPGQALVDPLCRDAGYAEFAIRPALPPLQLRRRYLRSDAA